MVKFWVFRHKGAWSITWCARQMRSRSWRLRNLLTTSAPKVKETPRSFSPQPWTSLSGSDHSRSHSKPDKNKTKNKGSQKYEESKEELSWRQCSSHMCFPFFLNYMWSPETTDKKNTQTLSQSADQHFSSGSYTDTAAPQTCVRDVGGSHDASNLFHGLQIRWEP